MQTNSSPQPAASQFPAPIPGRVASIPIEAWLVFAAAYGLEVLEARGDILVCRINPQQDSSQ